MAAGAHPQGLLSAIVNPDFTILGNKALFEGRDTTGNINLWVTDGTSNGTSKLAVAGVYSGGLFNTASHFTADLTAFGNKVLFAGVDASGHDQLWMTDGTSAGTSELAVSGANPGGLFSTAFSTRIPISRCWAARRCLQALTRRIVQTFG